MAVDISKIGPGDTVAVQCVVTDVLPRAVYSVAVRAAGCVQAQPTWVLPSDIVSHTPRELQKGDKVRFNGTARDWSVVSVDGGYAWVREIACDRDQAVIPLSDLERIP